MENKDLKLYPEFRNLLPRPSDMALSLIREGIMEKKFVPPLITWKGILVDGYIRYDICKELGIPFECEEMEFDSIEEAKFFKIKNQLLQRNITVFQKCEIVYPFEGFITEQVEKQRRKAISAYQLSKQTGIERYETTNNEDTGTSIAKYVGTTRAMWYRAKALIENADEEAKELLRTGKLKIYPTYLRLKAGESLIPKATSSDDDDAGNDDFDSEAEVATATKRCVDPASQSTTPTAMQTATRAGGKAETEPKHKIGERINRSNDGADRTEANTEVSNTDDDIGFGRESASAVISTQNHGNHSADNAGTGISETDNTHFSKGAAIDAELEAELAADSEASDEEDWSTDDVDIDHDPYISEIDINDPDTHLPEAVPHYEMPKRNPIPFPLVRQQVQSSIQKMLFELLVGLCGLRDDDLDRRDEILEIVKYGFKKAKKLIERETTNR